MSDRNRTPLFRRSDLIAGRYRVLRVVGAGASGEVYEVEDLDLKVPVALKTLRSEKLGDPQARERFRREITLARRVSHPNVCRTFDVGTHMQDRGPNSLPDEIVFLTMEMVSGETLAERLERSGPLSSAEAQPIAEQMAAGLDAAHAAGVVHRDFKSANVILVPLAAEDRAKAKSAFRVVITDFGLARLQGGVGHRSSADVTLADVIVGSPAYMAPEQVRSSEVSSQADIYAFGVVLYETVTGGLPFEGDVLGTALQKLTEVAPTPRRHVADLDARWERVILRCLERDPVRRFASAGEAAAALAGTMAIPVERGQRWLPKSPRARWIVATLLFAAALMLLGVWMGPCSARSERVARPQLGGGVGESVSALEPPRTGDSGTEASKLRPTVAMVGIASLSEDPEAAWIAQAVGEMLRSELAAGGALRVVPAETVTNMVRDLGLKPSTLGADSLERIRRYSGIDHVIGGSAVIVGSKGQREIRLDLRTQDVRTGEAQSPVILARGEAALIELVVEAGSKLRAQLGALVVSQADLQAVRSAMPALGAAELYARGLERLHLADPLRARELLEQAIAVQERYPLAHSALASAWSALGYDAKASASARRAFELSPGLPLADRLWIEGNHRLFAGEGGPATDVFQTLWSLYPDQLEYGLRLAAAQAENGQQDAALGVIDRLRKLPPPDSDDPRLDLAESDAAISASDFQRSVAASERAIQKGLAREQKALVARARLTQAWALRNLGEADRGQDVAAQARTLFEEIGQMDGVARALTLLSTFLRDRGDLAGARVLDQEALEVFRRVGNERQAALALNNLGKGMALRGDLAEARGHLEEALQICRRIEDQEGIARQTNNLAEVILQMGNAQAAEALYRDALARCRRSGDKRICADVARGLGDALRSLGRFDDASASYRESLTVARELGLRRYEAFALHGLGETLAARGEVGAAREHHESALALRRELGERANAADSQLALAELDLVANQPKQAENRASEAERQFGAEQRDRRAVALALRVRALAAQGSLPAATALYKELNDLTRSTQSPLTRRAVERAGAELEQAKTPAR